MDDILSKRRLHWLEHVIWMNHQRTSRQALHWEVPGVKRGPGHLRTNLRSTVNKDLLRMGITWEEVEMAAQTRSEWRRSVAHFSTWMRVESRSCKSITINHNGGINFSRRWEEGLFVFKLLCYDYWKFLPNVIRMWRHLTTHQTND